MSNHPSVAKDAYKTPPSPFTKVKPASLPKTNLVTERGTSDDFKK